MNYEIRRTPIADPSAWRAAAVDPFDEIYSDPDLGLRFNVQPGDGEIVFNPATFNGRIDDDDAGHLHAKRHMLRWWRTIPNACSLPPNFEGVRKFCATFACSPNGSGVK